MIWTIIAIILVIWLLGFLFDIAGTFVHILLAVAAILLIWNLIAGRRATA